MVKCICVDGWTTCGQWPFLLSHTFIQCHANDVVYSCHASNPHYNQQVIPKYHYESTCKIWLVISHWDQSHALSVCHTWQIKNLVETFSHRCCIITETFHEIYVVGHIENIIKQFEILNAFNENKVTWPNKSPLPMLT